MKAQSLKEKVNSLEKQLSSTISSLKKDLERVRMEFTDAIEVKHESLVSTIESEAFNAKRMIDALKAEFEENRKHFQSKGNEKITKIKDKCS